MDGLTRKRLGVYLGLSFGLSWALVLIIWRTGGLMNSPLLMQTPGISLAAVLLMLVMLMPALANVLTRLITREGKQDLWLHPARNQKPALWWLIAWFLPGIGTVLGAVIYFLLFPAHFDPALTTLQSQIAQSAPAGTALPSLWLIVLGAFLQALLLSPILNSLFTFGEEFGWRAYLLPKLMPLGGRKAALLSGLVWGIWHAPIIAMGHNYGITYPGYPWLGILAMVWFCLVFSVVFTWLTLKGGSVWPAVIAHAGINGIAAISALVAKGEPNPLLGPMPVGLIGGAAFTLLALVLLLSPNALTPGQEQHRWVARPIQDDSTHPSEAA